MRKDRAIEIRERAMAILSVSSIYDTSEVRRNFLRQIRLVHPDGPHRHDQNVPGFDNTQVARLLIQAYGCLTGRNWPTSMLENDALVGTLLGGRITPMSQTTTGEQWNASQFYDQFQNSIWPEPSKAEAQRHASYKFKGL
ncbi:MAG: hypothetical protein JXR77_15065 [Lentisphaeria bacterium]|nr:hypothetical protein [Lentisphaeria bacterium]